MRVGVLFGFQEKATVGADGEIERVIHLPGAVVDLDDDVAKVEIARNRVVPVDPATEPRDGHQLETVGQEVLDFAKHSAEDVAKRQGAAE